MKKIEYKAPEMEVIKLAINRAVLVGVSGEGETPGYGGEIPGEGPEE